jgi:hypothetical protein
MLCWPGGHRLKETRRAVQVRAFKGVAENQKSEITGRYGDIHVVLRLEAQ